MNSLEYKTCTFERFARVLTTVWHWAIMADVHHSVLCDYGVLWAMFDEYFIRIYCVYFVKIKCNAQNFIHLTDSNEH